MPFLGWRVVWAAFVLAVFGWGVGFYGPPVYLHAVIERTGWALPLVSTAVTVHFLIGAVVVANLPALHRRFGLPTITMAGAAALGAGVLGWAIAREPWQLFAAALLSGTGWVALGAAAVNAIVAPWFVRFRPAALATAYNGASIGGVIFSPLWVALIDSIGFARAAGAIGGVMVLTIGALSRRVFALTPERAGLLPDGDVVGVAATRVIAVRSRAVPGSALWRDRMFLTLATGMALGLFAQIGLLAHLFSVLAPALGGQAAGLAMGMATGCAIAGRTIVGWLMPIGADRRLVACASLGVQAAGSAILVLSAGHSVPLLLLGVVLFGAGIGNATSLPPMIAQVEFVQDDAPRVVSLIVALGQATYAFAPALFGIARSAGPAVFDLSPGSATVAFAAAVIVQLAAIACYLAGRR
ncbi:MAG TPA: MFS transporter [Candidatus Acidoferrum sp.]|jgi:MFS family permease|nr:MFS transporter [Candidatus Acidoferrum sp.]